MFVSTKNHDKYCLRQIVILVNSSALEKLEINSLTRKCQSLLKHIPVHFRFYHFSIGAALLVFRLRFK